MKLVRFLDENEKPRYGRMLNPQTMELELMEGEPFSALAPTGKTAEIVRLLPPVAPPNVIAVGLNYSDHARESGSKIPNAPQLFLKATTSVIGAGEPIVLPPPAPDEVDYEAELVIVMGRQARDLDEEAIRDCILGYTCGNDVSARDCQRRLDKQWARAKSFDTFCPLGPWLVTAEELDPRNLAIRSVLNGEIRQDSRTSRMLFDPYEVASYISRQFTLLPGTVILTGTPAGVGFAAKPPRFLRPGDTIAVEIEGIGRLENPVRTA